MIHTLKTEVERLNGRMRAVGGVDGNYCDLTSIYSDIDQLNGTIEHLRRENQQLKLALKGLNQDFARQDQGEHSGVRQLREKIAKMEANLQLAEENKPGEQAIRGWERLRVVELEGDQQRLVRQVHSLEDQCRQLRRELDAATGAKLQVGDKLENLMKEHNSLKKKSLELLKRNGQLENKAHVTESDKGRIVDRVQKLQSQHREEMEQMKNTLKLLNEKLYLVNQDSKDRKTFLEIDALYTQEKREMTNRIMFLEDRVATLSSEASQMEDKLFEQHAIIKDLAKSNDLLEMDREKLEVMTEEFTALTEELEIVAKERDEATEEIKSLEKQLHELHERLRSSLQQHAEADAKRHQLLTEKDALESRFSDVAAQLEALKKKSETLEHEKRVQERTAEL